MPISLPVSPEGPIRKETPLEQALKELHALEESYRKSGGPMVDPDKMKEVQNRVQRLIENNKTAKQSGMDYDPALDSIDESMAA